MSKSRINQIGIKAYSLELLQIYGLFKNRLLMLRNAPNKELFNRKIEESGFDLENIGIFIRMSDPVTSIKLPKGRFHDTDAAYEFIKEVKKDNWTVIVHDQLKGKYGGTITNIGGRLLMEFIEGEWNADYTICPDELIFNKDGSIEKKIYSKNRKSAVFRNGKPIHIDVKPLRRDELEKILYLMNENIESLFKLTEESGFNSIEFYISPKYEFLPFELQNINNTDISDKLRKEKIKTDFFEISSNHDLQNWDGEKKLLLTIPCDLDRGNQLLEVASKISGKTEIVYVRYGVLSHPSIVLREMGFEVKQLTEDYRE